MIKTIHILGASGSGTTTLRKIINYKFGYTHLDTDDYFWMPTDPPFTTKRLPEERQKLLKDDMGKSDKKVISGSLCGWGDIFIPDFDLVVYVETPSDERIQRLEKREYERFGDRILLGGDMYDNHREFIEWAKTYDNAGLDSRSRTLHIEWMKIFKCPIVIIDGTNIERMSDAVSYDVLEWLLFFKKAI
ncbi:MAG: AAA family ATPase [Saccharofermentanales bacterium]